MKNLKLALLAVTLLITNLSTQAQFVGHLVKPEKKRSVMVYNFYNYPIEVGLEEKSFNLPRPNPKLTLINPNEYTAFWEAVAGDVVVVQAHSRTPTPHFGSMAYKIRPEDINASRDVRSWDVDLLVLPIPSTKGGAYIVQAGDIKASGLSYVKAKSEK